VIPKPVPQFLGVTELLLDVLLKRLGDRFTADGFEQDGVGQVVLDRLDFVLVRFLQQSHHVV
jgi:hypothetical protein